MLRISLQTAPSLRTALLAALVGALIGGTASGPMPARAELGDAFAVRHAAELGEAGVAYFRSAAQINGPTGLAGDGHAFWVADSGGRRLLQFGSNGRLLDEIGRAGLTWSVGGADIPMRRIEDVAVVYRPRTDDDPPAPDPDADPGIAVIWWVDSEAHLAVGFDRATGGLTVLGAPDEPGGGADHLRAPTGVVADSSGRMFVSDTGNDRVQVFEPGAGTDAVATIGAGELLAPARMAWRADQLYVADAGRHRVAVFDVSDPRAASLTDSFGRTDAPGDTTDALDTPSGLAVDAAFVYVADAGNCRVQMLRRMTGDHWESVGSPGGCATGPGAGSDAIVRPLDVAQDERGFLYVSDGGRMQVHQFHPDRAYLRSYGTTGMPYLTDDEHLNAPAGVAAHGERGAVVVEAAGHRALAYGDDGEAEWEFGTAGLPDGAGLNGPRDVARTADGRYAVVEGGVHRVRFLDPDGSSAGEIGGPDPGASDGQFSSPEGVGAAADGRLGVADAGNHRVQLFDAGGAHIATLGETGRPGADTDRFNAPADVAFGAGGEIYVADAGNHRVQVFDAALAHVRTLGRTGSPGDAFDRLRSPRRLATDGEGRLYVADTGDHRVVVFDADGGFLTAIGGRYGAGTGGMREPLGVDVAPDGRLWVADWGNHRVLAFDRPTAPWTAASPSGFGKRAVSGVASLASFRGALYAGTTVEPTRDGAAAILRADAAGDWDAVVDGDVGHPDARSVASMVAHGDRLYAGVGVWCRTETPDSAAPTDTQAWLGAECRDGPGAAEGGEVWSTADGSTWDVDVSGGLGDVAQAEVSALGVHDGVLYAGTTSRDAERGARIWRQGAGGAWEVGSTGDLGADFGNAAVTAMASFTGTLWAGTCHRSGAGQLWRSADGRTWLPGGASGGPALGSGSGACVADMAIFGDALYAAAGSGDERLGLPGSAVEVWRCKRCDGTDWEIAAPAGLGTSSNRGRAAFGSLSVPPFEFLYLAVGNAEGLEVWRSSDGVNWEQSDIGGFGDDNNVALGGPGSLALHGGRLFVGTRNGAHGGELWTTAGGRPSIVPTPGPGPRPTPTPRPRTDPPTGRARYVRVDQWPAARVIPQDVIGNIPEMAVTDDGAVFLLDASNQRVMRLAADDTWQPAFGNIGFGEERMGQAGALDVDAPRDVVYVADHASERLLRYSLEGDFIGAWQGIYATGIEVQADGSIWIADGLAGGVRHLAPDGAEIERFGSFGDREDDQFVALRDLTVDADGNLFVLDLNGARLRLFRPFGGTYRRVRTLDLGGVRFRDCGVGAASRVTAVAAERVLLERCIIEGSVPIDVLPVQHTGADLFWVQARTIAPGGGHHVALAVYDTDRRDATNETWPVVVRYATDGFDIPARFVRGRYLDAASAAADGTIGGPRRLSTAPDGSLMVTDNFGGLRQRAPDGRVLRDLPLVPYPSRVNPLYLLPEMAIGEGESGRVMGVGYSRDGRFGRLVAVYAETELRRYCRARRCEVNPYLVTRWETTLPSLTEAVAAVAHEPVNNQFVVLTRYHTAPSVRGIESIEYRLLVYPLAYNGRREELLLEGDDRLVIWADVDAGPDGRILALDTLNDRVQVYGPDLTDLGMVPVPKDAWRVAGGPSGEIFVLTVYGHVVRLAPDGTLLSRFVARPHAGVPPTSLVELTVDASGWVYTIDELANQVTVFAPEGMEDEVLMGGTCNLTGDKWAVPRDVLLGDEVEVLLSILGTCGFEEQPADIVLAVNTFGRTMGNDPGRALANNLRRARQIAALTDLDQHRLAVLAFATNEDVRTELTDSSYAVARALFSANAGRGSPRNYTALKAASDRFDAASATRQRVIIVVSPGSDDDAGTAYAEALKADGALIVVVNGSSVIASGDLYNNVQVDPRAMGAGKPAHRRAITRFKPDILARSGSLVDRLPGNMTYIAGSAEPPATWDAAARTLTWRLADLPLAPSLFRFRVRPEEEGEWPTNVEAFAEGSDGWGDPFRVDYPVPRVRVYGELPPTATPTPSPTSTPEPTSTPGPTRVPVPIFLPIAVSQECTPRDRNADIVLLFDTSGSMSQPTSVGGPEKLAAAKAAGRGFLEQLVEGRDQAALVQFNAEVRLLVPLTDDPTAVIAGLDLLEQAPGTRIDSALAAGREELLSERRRAENNPVLILLTDGEPTGTTPEDVRAAAAEAHAAGLLVFAIGLGSDLDDDLLRDVASRPDWYFRAPDTADLEAIYDAIVDELPCTLAWP